MPREFEPGRLIWDQLVLLNNAWSTHEDLFGGPPETRALLDRTARWFFQNHRRLLVREILLAISRLTDSEATAGKRNLILATILEDPELDAQPAVRERLRGKIQVLVQESEPIRRRRHKYIAHIDHELAVGATAPPPPIAWQDVGDSIRTAEAIYREYALAIDRDVSFELHALGDAKHLIRKLEDAEKWLRYSMHSLRTRGTLPDDPPTAA